MQHFGDNPFELPSNTDLEKVLGKNLDHTNPLEMKSYTNDGKTKLFPFWTPVKDPTVDADDYKSYWDKKDKALDVKKKDDKVGVVQPKDASKSYESNDLLDRIKGLIKKQNNEKTVDKSGAVNAHSENMKDTSTSKPDVVNKVDVPMEPVVDKPSTPKVPKKEKGEMGAVQPKADMGTQNVPGEPKSDKVKKSEKGQMGVVKPPKNDVKPDATAINFDKYKTDHIKKS